MCTIFSEYDSRLGERLHVERNRTRIGRKIETVDDDHGQHE